MDNDRFKIKDYNIYKIPQGAKKHTCPLCSHERKKKTQQCMIIDWESGLGKCFHCDELIQLHTYHKKGDETPTNYNHKPMKIAEPKKLDITYHNPESVVKSMGGYKNNNLIQFLKQHFTVEQIHLAIIKYRIGTSNSHWKGATIFWQIDQDFKVRYGNVMQYKKETGKRAKINDKPLITTIDSLAKLNGKNYKYCLFGLHLLSQSDCKIVCVVESQFTAIVMSICNPNFIWLATGGLKKFNYKMLKPLQDYEVRAFPDKGFYYDWLSEAEDLNSMGFNIKVSKILESDKYSFLPKNADLDDVVMHELKNNKNEPQKEEQPIQKEVQESETIKTVIEAQVEQLAKSNPNILKLIKDFDLTDENGLDINLDNINIDDVSETRPPS